MQKVAALAAHLRERFGEITTLVHSVNGKKAQVAQGGRSQTLWGPGYIEEELQGRHFRISAESFFQTNTAAAEALYGAVIRLGEFSGRNTVGISIAGPAVLLYHWPTGCIGWWVLNWWRLRLPMLMSTRSLTGWIIASF